MTSLRAAARRMRRLIADTGGVTIIEYAVITFFVAIAMGFVLPNFSDALKGLYDRTSSVLEGIAPDRPDDDDRDGRRKRGK